MLEVGGAGPSLLSFLDGFREVEVDYCRIRRSVPKPLSACHACLAAGHWEFPAGESAVRPVGYQAVVSRVGFIVFPTLCGRPMDRACPK